MNIKIHKTILSVCEQPRLMRQLICAGSAEASLLKNGRSTKISCACSLFFQDDEHFLQQLFSQIQDEKVDDTRRRDLVFFLKEFCTFSQTLQPQGRETFFKVRILHFE